MYGSDVASFAARRGEAAITAPARPLPPSARAASRPPGAVLLCKRLPMRSLEIDVEHVAPQSAGGGFGKRGRHPYFVCVFAEEARPGLVGGRSCGAEHQPRSQGTKPKRSGTCLPTDPDHLSIR